MPWTFDIDLAPGCTNIEATLSPIIDDPVKLLDALLKTDMLKGTRERWEQSNADHLIRAIESDPRQNGYHYAKLFDGWFRDWLLKHHMPQKGQNLVIEGKLCALWVESPKGARQ